MEGSHASQFNHVNCALYPARRGIEKANHWHRRLLRLRRNRPSRRRTAEKRDELATPHDRPQLQEPPYYRLKLAL